MHSIFILILSFIGFAFYLIYDINSFTIHNRLLSCGFLIGSLLIFIATLTAIWQTGKEGGFSGPGDVILIIFALLALVCLIYSLFFALPFRETYVSQIECRNVCDKGVYALCRHPGVICFFVIYLFLGLAALPTQFWKIGVVLSVLNLSYAWFQDCVTFKKTFDNYKEYCNQVPFIIPNRESIRNARRTWGIIDKKEGKK